MGVYRGDDYRDVLAATGELGGGGGVVWVWRVEAASSTLGVGKRFSPGLTHAFMRPCRCAAGRRCSVIPLSLHAWTPLNGSAPALSEATAEVPVGHR